MQGSIVISTIVQSPNHQISCTGYWWKMDTKDSVVVFLLLLSLGLFGSVTYCVWNKQAQLASELDVLQN